MTPMIDVVFQLIVFFLVSMRFRTLDMKIEASFPRDGGVVPGPARPPKPHVDVRLARPSAASPVTLRVSGATLGDAADEAAWARLRDHATAVRERQAGFGGDPESVHGEVDAAPAVPAGAVIRALDVLRGAGLSEIRFVGTPRPDASSR
jgi:biopolymer transport protein ExbD